jgi:hypothetical protein
MIILIHWYRHMQQPEQLNWLLSIEPFAKLRFSFKIKACEKFYHRHMIDIPRIKF